MSMKGMLLMIVFYIRYLIVTNPPVVDYDYDYYQVPVLWLWLLPIPSIVIMIITNPPVCVAVHLIVGLNGSNHVSQEVHLVVVENLMKS